MELKTLLAGEAWSYSIEEGWPVSPYVNSIGATGHSTGFTIKVRWSSRTV